MGFIQTVIIFVGYLRGLAAIIITLAGSIILQIIGRAGYAGVFFLMALESAAIPIPSEITMPFSGFLAARGIFNFWLAVFAGTIGNAIGSLALYWIGEYGGRAFISRWGWFFFLKDSHILKAESWFEKYGAPSVFFGRLLPVVRTYISLPAGIAKMNFWKFNAYTLIGSFLWTLLLTYIGFYLGERWNILESYFRKLDIAILMVAVVLIAWFLIKYSRRDLPKANG